jgi:hypothetical protein
MAKSPLEHLWRCALDWSKRWPDAAKMENKDTNGVAHYPGWSLPALKYLYEERKITASGHETTDTDPGTATSKDDYSMETYILSTNHYQSSCSRIWIRSPKPAQSRSLLSQSQKAAQDFPREYLQFCRKENRRLR